MDGDAGLHIGGGGENLAALDRDRRVASNQRRRDAAHGFDAERQRRDIDEHDAADLAGQHPGLDGRAGGDAFHRVDAHFGLALKQLLEVGTHRRHARRSADKDHPIDIARSDPRVVQRLIDRAAATLDHRIDEAVEFAAAKVEFEMARFAINRRQIRQAEVCREARGQIDLGRLGGLDEAGGGLAVATHIDAGGHLETFGQMLEDSLVHVGAAELRIAAGGLDFKDPLAELHDRDVERPAAEVDHRDAQFLTQPVETVGERSCGRLVDQTHHVEAGDSAGVLGRGALVVVKIGRNGDDRLVHRFAEKSLGVALDLLQQECRELLRRVIAIAQTDGFALAHPALEGRRGALGVGRCLAPGRFADQQLTVGGQGHVAGKRLAADADAFGAGNDDRSAAAQNRRRRV